MIAWILIVLVNYSFAIINAGDRVYTADENSNTVSVIDPLNEKLIGQIQLGPPRVQALNSVSSGQVNVHGLCASPDHKTLAVVSNISNGVVFIDVATNLPKGTFYVGRSPHTCAYTKDGKEVWVVVRGQDYISVIDAKKMTETKRIQTTPGPSMVLFDKENKYAFTGSAFFPFVDVTDVKTKKVIKKIPIEGSFMPIGAMNPDKTEAWIVLKDKDKVVRIDTKNLKVISYLDTGFYTQHVFLVPKDSQSYWSYVTVGGLGLVKVYLVEKEVVKEITQIKTGGVPHGVWSSPQGEKIFVGLELGDSVSVLDGESKKEKVKIKIGQSPQTVLYVADAITNSRAGTDNLTPLIQAVNSLEFRMSDKNFQPMGSFSIRNIGVIDYFSLILKNLKNNTEYSFYSGDKENLVVTFSSDAKGVAVINGVGSSSGALYKRAQLLSSSKKSFYLFEAKSKFNEAEFVGKSILE